MKSKIVFMGTPEFALPSLKMLIEQGYNLCAVVCQPDRPSGRGHKLTAPPVKVFAEKCGIPVLQFEKLSRDGVEQLKRLGAELFITVAFGQILSQEVLNIPKLGTINVHASLLPKLRGAAPIEWAVINGETKTGVTTMMTVLTLDAGDMLEFAEVDIAPDMGAAQLREQLSAVGAEVLKTTLEKLAVGTLLRKPQDETQMTKCPMFKKGFGEIDFSKTPREIVNLVRGLDGVGGAFLMYGADKLKIFAAKSGISTGKCGEVLTCDEKNGFCLACLDGSIMISVVSGLGSKKMSATEFLRGHRLDKKFLEEKIKK